MIIRLLIGIWWHLPPCRLSTDRDQMALGRGMTKVWDVRTGSCQQDLPVDSAHLEFSPDGRWVVTGTSGGFRFWEVGPWRLGPTPAWDPRRGGGPAFFCAGGGLATALAP